MSKSLSTFLIKENSTLKRAIKLINISSHKCLLVIDKNEKLIGTLSDGDIRKYLIKNLDLSVPINNVFNKNPIKFYENKYNINDLKKIFSKNLVDIVPILNNYDKVLSIVTWIDLIDYREKKKNIFDIFILAGGQGQRLYPITKKTPKPLIKLIDEAMIKKIVDKFLNQGFYNVFISLNYKKSLIKKYFNDIYKNYSQLNLKFIDEKTPLGTIGSLKLIKKNDLADNYIVINCDTLISYDFNKMIEFHLNNKADMTIIGSETNISIPYGQLKKKGKKVVDIIEKPNFPLILNVGCYIINKKVIPLIPPKKKYDATDLIQKAIKYNLNVYSYNISQYDWTEIGKTSDLNNLEKILNNY